MTIEFWPRSPRKPRTAAKPRKRKPKRPKLPVPAGKAHQQLSQAIICGDHELASWIDGAVKAGMVSGKPQLVRELKKRLDLVMVPLEE
jgi:hypothetical protein